MEKDDVNRLTDALEQFSEIAKKFQGSGGFNNGIHFDTSGVAVGFMLVLVAVLLTICFSQSGTITRIQSENDTKVKEMKDTLREMERKLDRAEDYVNQIYRTQHLKPKTEAK